MLIDFILLSHQYDKSLGDAQSFNFTFIQFYKRKTARRLVKRPSVGGQDLKHAMMTTEAWDIVTVRGYGFCPYVILDQPGSLRQLNRVRLRVLGAREAIC